MLRIPNPPAERMRSMLGARTADPRLAVRVGCAPGVIEAAAVEVR
jgi:hypothetical protein